MIYTPENSPGSITVDVEKGEYIYDVLAVDMDNATVTFFERPLRFINGNSIATKTRRFRVVKRVTSALSTQGTIFLCEQEIFPVCPRIPQRQFPPE